MSCFLKLSYGKTWALPLPFDRVVEINIERLSAHIPDVFTPETPFPGFSVSNRNGQWVAQAADQPIVVDGVTAHNRVLQDHSSIATGIFEFEVRLHPRWASFAEFQHAIATDGAAFLAGRNMLRSYVEDHRKTLFAIVDATASEDIPRYLADPNSGMISLLQGRAAREHFLEAPYLAPLDGRSEFTQDFLLRGLEEAWGVIISSATEVLSDFLPRLRTNLWASLNNEKLFFRFYDPDIAAKWVSTLDQSGLESFLGNEIAEFLFQDGDQISCVTRSGTATLA